MAREATGREAPNEGADGGRWAWTLFRVSGIRVRAHLSLILFLPFLVWLIAAQVPVLADLPLVRADAARVVGAFGGYGGWAAGVVVAFGLFGSVLLHELGHALLAKSRGVPVPTITLWIFGGMSHLEPEDTPRPATEAAFAAAGPAVSFVLGGVALAAALFVPFEWARFVVAYLGFLNVVLGLFNLLPAFPLDGGRILRAGLATRMSHARATRAAATVGKTLAIAMGILGLFFNIFLVFIAFFVYMAANAESRQTQVLAALEGIPVSSLMERNPPTASPDDRLEDLVGRMLHDGVVGFPVLDAGKVVGVVTLTDIRRVPAEMRPTTPVAEVMTRDLATTLEATPASEALQRMLHRKVGRLLVLRNGGTLEGVVTREGILRAFEISRVLGTEERGDRPEAPGRPF